MSKLLTVTALALLAMTVTAEEKKSLGQKLCNYFSRFPGCGSTESEPSEDSVQALNCLEFPNTEFCIKARLSWSDEEKKLFWSKVNAQLDTFADDLQEEEPAMLGGVINCAKYTDDKRCIALRKKWAEEEKLGVGDTGFVSGIFEEDSEPTLDCTKIKNSLTSFCRQKAMEERMVFCMGNPEAPRCLEKPSTRPILFEDDNEQALSLGGAINCQVYPDTAFCVKARAQWEAEKALEESKSLGGAINCQAYPDAPFCIRARAQWAAEQAALLEEDEPVAPRGRMGLVNCRQFPDAPSCATIKLQDESQQLGAINCVRYADDARCIALRKKWAEEEKLGVGNTGFVSGFF